MKNQIKCPRKLPISRKEKSIVGNIEKFIYTKLKLQTSYDNQDKPEPEFSKYTAGGTIRAFNISAALNFQLIMAFSANIIEPITIYMTSISV